VGIIGLGEVAQIIHLPILQTLADRYEIAALCDISPALLQTIGQRHNVTNLYTDAHALAAQPDLDAVFVLNSDEYHAESAIFAANNHKHVLIEKPMCLTFSEAEAIIRARDAAGVRIMVGYMRRFAPAFTEAVRQVKELDKINYARVRDIIGQNRFFIEQSTVVQRFDDFPAWAGQDRTERAERLLKEAIGDASPELKRAYRLLCGLSSHDLSAMREIIGMPERVRAATTWNGGSFITAIFEYPGFNVTFETGIDKIRRFDAHIEVYGEEKSIRVQYNTPYIRHLPTRLITRETAGEAYVETEMRPTFKDPYTVELEHFYEVIVNGVEPKTPPEDFLQDLKIFQMIMQAF
jgi:predicted dehydrogenase